MASSVDVKDGWTEDGNSLSNAFCTNHGDTGLKILNVLNLISPVVAVVILTTIICTITQQSALISQQRPFLISPNCNIPEPRIVGTSIRGQKSVQHFRSRLACVGASGRWEYNNTPRHIPWNLYGDPFAHVCDHNHKSRDAGNIAFAEADMVASQGGDWKVREALKWTWQANTSCPFRPVDRTDFCEKIGSGRNILLVGDSINHQIQWAFMNHLMTNFSNNGWSMSGVRSMQGEEVCGDVLKNGGFNISWVRNDRLSPIKSVQDAPNFNVYQWPWLDRLEEWNIKILILNRGAHYEPDQGYAESLRIIFRILQTQFPHLIVLYRNTPPGHLNCTSYSKPLKERQSPMELPNHWGDFQAQNEMAKAIVERWGYVYMDVDSMLSLRPDGHHRPDDCLHYCIPGPLDVVVQLFYNILRLFAQHEKEEK